MERVIRLPTPASRLGLVMVGRGRGGCCISLLYTTRLWGVVCNLRLCCESYARSFPRDLAAVSRYQRARIVRPQVQLL